MSLLEKATLRSGVSQDDASAIDKSEFVPAAFLGQGSLSAALYKLLQQVVSLSLQKHFTVSDRGLYIITTLGVLFGRGRESQPIWLLVALTSSEDLDLLHLFIRPELLPMKSREMLLLCTLCGRNLFLKCTVLRATAALLWREAKSVSMRRSMILNTF